jgi:hypothetical protein
MSAPHPGVSRDVVMRIEHENPPDLRPSVSSADQKKKPAAFLDGRDEHTT